MLKPTWTVFVLLAVTLLSGAIFACASSGDDDDDATASDDDLVVDDDDDDTTDDDTSDDDTDDDDTTDDDTADDDTADDDTADDDTTDDDLDLDLPDGVDGLFDEDDLKAFLDAGGTINDGDSPPTIDGSYALDDLKITVDPDGNEGNPVLGFAIIFANQSGDEIDVDQGPLPPSKIGHTTQLAGYIAGADDCFSVFTKSPESYKSCDYDFSMIFSGCVVTDGLGDFEWLAEYKNKTGTPGDCAELPGKGEVRITVEDDGLAEEIILNTK
ncbi:hypothetical protein KDL45_07420 [bacterium]|nr:hypothetical protein [bacterium]